MQKFKIKADFKALGKKFALGIWRQGTVPRLLFCDYFVLTVRRREAFASELTTPLALLTNSIRGRATKESENRSLLRQEKEKLQPSSVEAFLGGVSGMKVELPYPGFIHSSTYRIHIYLLSLIH